jgi:hypothetical protein
MSQRTAQLFPAPPGDLAADRFEDEAAAVALSPIDLFDELGRKGHGHASGGHLDMIILLIIRSGVKGYRCSSLHTA